ncbi:MAG TPA: SemiSWEET family transporter [Gaiellaceae bacterium]
MVTYFATAAATWGVAMALAPLLQIRAIRLHRTSQGVSVGYQQVLLVGFFLWIAYGVADSNLALIVPNTVAAAVSIATILIARRFRP